VSDYIIPSQEGQGEGRQNNADFCNQKIKHDPGQKWETQKLELGSA
jgi:hypothetical protein